MLNQGTVTVDQPLTYDLSGGSTFTNEGTVTLSQPMNASAATVRNEVGSIDGSGSGVAHGGRAASFVQSGGDTTGNPVVTLQLRPHVRRAGDRNQRRRDAPERRH